MAENCQKHCQKQGHLLAVKHMIKNVIKILQGSEVTQNALDGLIMYHLMIFLQTFCSVCLPNGMSEDKVGHF